MIHGAIVPISDFCRTGSGTTPSRAKAGEYYSGDIPWVKSGELRENEIFETGEHVTDVALAETSLKLVPKGALLVAMYGATVGRVGILGVQATTNQAVCHVIPDPALADIRYMFHALQYKANELVLRGVGGAQPNISQGTIRDTKIFLPCLEEQKRIAESLDQADALRRARRRALDRLNDLGQSIFYEMVAREEFYLKPINLGEVVSEFRYGTSTKATSEGHPVLRIPNVVGGEIALSDLKTVALPKSEFERLSLSPGDLLFVRTNGNRSYVGRCAVVPELFDGDETSPQEYVFASYLIRARLISEMNPKFVQAFLDIGTGRRQLLEHTKTSAGQYNINIQGLSDIKIPNAPRAVQNLYASHVSSIKEARKTYQQHLSWLDGLYGSLQQRAFRGEL